MKEKPYTTSISFLCETLLEVNLPFFMEITGNNYVVKEAIHYKEVIAIGSVQQSKSLLTTAWNAFYMKSRLLDEVDFQLAINKAYHSYFTKPIPLKKLAKTANSGGWDLL